MSEKLKPNFTAIPNVILDQIMRTLAPGATKVLFAICRFTYGWGKPEGDRISLKQLQEITGMARGSVARSIKELGALVAVNAGDPSRQLASEYRINVEISDDDLVSLRDQGLVSKKDQASLLASLSGETFQRKSKERRNTGAKAPESFSNKRSGKRTRRAGAVPANLQPAVSRIVARINDLAGTRYRDDKPGPLKNLIQKLAEGRTEADCMAVVEGRHVAWRNDDKMMEYFRPSTLFAEAHFEDYLQATQRANVNGRAPDDPQWRKETFINA